MSGDGFRYHLGSGPEIFLKRIGAPGAVASVATAGSAAAWTACGTSGCAGASGLATASGIACGGCGFDLSWAKLASAGTAFASGAGTRVRARSTAVSGTTTGVGAAIVSAPRRQVARPLRGRERFSDRSPRQRLSRASVRLGQLGSAQSGDHLGHRGGKVREHCGCGNVYGFAPRGCVQCDLRYRDSRRFGSYLGCRNGGRIVPFNLRYDDGGRLGNCLGCYCSRFQHHCGSGKGSSVRDRAEFTLGHDRLCGLGDDLFRRDGKFLDCLGRGIGGWFADRALLDLRFDGGCRFGDGFFRRCGKFLDCLGRGNGGFDDRALLNLRFDGQ